MAVDAAAAKIMKNERGADVSTTVSIQVVCSVVDVSICNRFGERHPHARGLQTNCHTLWLPLAHMPSHTK